MARIRVAIVLSFLILNIGVAGLMSRTASAQASLSMIATASKTRAKIGEFIELSVQVTNNGNEVASGVVVTINPPDALNASGTWCPFVGSSTVDDCTIGSLGAGSSAEASFFIEIGHKSPNGPIRVTLSDSNGEVSHVDVGPIKITGASKR